jgi:hypothetical protein
MRLFFLTIITAGIAAAQAPTFYKDVAPILQARCQECHRKGEIAPMSLVTYEESRPFARAIKNAVSSRTMPPWYADSHTGKFANDRSLSEAEIKTLTAWADGGAAPGDPKDAPKPRTFTDGWMISKPDLVLDIGTDFAVPAKGTVEYTYFVIPTGFTEDRWVTELEVRPGDKSVVHHVIAYIRPKGSRFQADAKPGVPYVPPGAGQQPAQHPPQSDRARLYGINNNGYEMGSVYVPGGVAYRTLSGQARLIPAGADIVVQMHYTANGKATTDRTKVGMVFAKQPPKERVVNAFIMNETLRIPPGAGNHQVVGRVTLQKPATLQSLFPHMHLRGKSFYYEVKYPDGRTEKLLDVPRYDFNWQLTYDLAKPIELPAGTELIATAFYDNSANNKFNPDPTKEVFWGDQSWEEMLAGFVDLAIPTGMNPLDLTRAAAR